LVRKSKKCRLGLFARASKMCRYLCLLRERVYDAYSFANPLIPTFSPQWEKELNPMN